MVCGRDAYDEAPFRAQQREEDRKKRDEAAAYKIAAFFVKTFGKGAVLSDCAENKPTKIQLAETYPGCLLVHHRGHEVFVDSSQDPEAENKFRAWCKDNLPHAKIFPRTCSK